MSLGNGKTLEISTVNIAVIFEIVIKITVGQILSIYGSVETLKNNLRIRKLRQSTRNSE